MTYNVGLNIELPSYSLGGSPEVVSNIFASHNPLVVKVQEVNAQVISIILSAGTICNIEIDTALFSNEMVGKKIYISSLVYTGLYEITHVVDGYNATINVITYTSNDTDGGWMFYNEMFFDLEYLQKFSVYINDTLIVKSSKDYTGYAEIDISEYCKRLLSLMSELWVNSGYDATTKDSENYLEIKLNISIHNVSTPPYYQEDNFTITNSINQLGYSLGNNMTEYATNSLIDDTYKNSQLVKFMTGFEVPKVYPGFPFSLSLINLDRQDAKVQFRKGQYDINRDYLTDDNADITTVFETNTLVRIPVLLAALNVNCKYILPRVTYSEDEFPLTQIIYLEVIKECIKNPIYIRWRNVEGGYEHFMFELFQEQEYSTKAIGEFKKYQSNIAASRGNSYLIGQQILKKITVIKEHATLNEFEQLCLMPSMIEVYDVANDKWNIALVEDKSNKSQLKSPAQPFLLTFAPPEIQSQSW